MSKYTKGVSKDREEGEERVDGYRGVMRRRAEGEGEKCCCVMKGKRGWMDDEE